jgi:hypothetical protein
MTGEENDRHGYSQPTRAQYDLLAARLANVRALLSPEAAMGTAPFGDGKRYFAEDDIRAALEVD